MRRAWVHTCFAIISICLLLFTIWQAYKLYENNKIIAAVQAVPETLTKANNTLNHPQAALAEANALSRGGQFGAAETLFVKLIDQHGFSALGQAARFNLANHYLRQGKRKDLPAGQTRPLLEIAKQRYRDLLQADPFDWDARYNLEVALRLAPEIVENKHDKGPPTQRVDVIVPDFKAKDLP